MGSPSAPSASWLLIFATLAMRNASSSGNFLTIVDHQMLVGVAALFAVAIPFEPFRLTPSWPLPRGVFLHDARPRHCRHVGLVSPRRPHRCDPDGHLPLPQPRLWGRHRLGAPWRTSGMTRRHRRSGRDGGDPCSPTLTPPCLGGQKRLDLPRDRGRIRLRVRPPGPHHNTIAINQNFVEIPLRRKPVLGLHCLIKRMRLCPNHMRDIRHRHIDPAINRRKGYPAHRPSPPAQSSQTGSQ